MKGLSIAVTLLLCAGCAPYGPWLFSTEEQREKWLLHPGMTVLECCSKKGLPMSGPSLNNMRGEGKVFQPKDDYTGFGYWPVHRVMSRLEEVRFEGGVAAEVHYTTLRGRNLGVLDKLFGKPDPYAGEVR